MAAARGRRDSCRLSLEHAGTGGAGAVHGTGASDDGDRRGGIARGLRPAPSAAACGGPRCGPLRPGHSPDQLVRVGARARARRRPRTLGRSPRSARSAAHARRQARAPVFRPERGLAVLHRAPRGLLPRGAARARHRTGAGAVHADGRRGRRACAPARSSRPRAGPPGRRSWPSRPARHTVRPSAGRPSARPKRSRRYRVEACRWCSWGRRRIGTRPGRSSRGRRTRPTSPISLHRSRRQDHARRVDGSFSPGAARSSRTTRAPCTSPRPSDVPSSRSSGPTDERRTLPSARTSSSSRTCGAGRACCASAPSITAACGRFRPRASWRP